MARQVIQRGSFPNDHAHADNWYVTAGKINDMTLDLYSLESQIISAGDVRFASLPTSEARISAARVQAAVELKTIVSIPLVMTPFEPTLVDFTNLSIRNVIEGGNYSVYQPEAYGAGGDNLRNDLANVQQCIAAAAGRGTVVFNKMFLCSNQVTLPSDTELVGLGWTTGLRFDFVLQSVADYYIRTASFSPGNTGVRLRDFTIRGAHPGGPLGIPTPSQCSGLRLTGSEMEVRGVQVDHIPSSSCILEGVSRTRFIANYIHDGGRDGITGGPVGTIPSTDVVIEGNTIVDCHDDLIACNMSVDTGAPGTTAPQRWVITGNTLTGGSSLSADNFARGIYISGATDILVEANQISKTNQPGVTVLVDPNTAGISSKISIVGNHISNVGTVGTDRGQSRHGILIGASVGVTGVDIKDNHITGSAENGILVNGATFFQIQNNYLADNGATGGADGVGIYIRGASYATTDGLVTGNSVLRSQAAGIYAPDCDRITISNNRCTNNGKEGSNDTLHTGITLEATSLAGSYLVHGNYCTDTQGTKTQNYGFVTRGILALAHVSLKNNYFANHEVSSILINTVPTVFERSGNQLSVAGAMSGRAAMVNGTVTVNTAEVVTADNIQLTRVVGAGTTRGELGVGTIVNGTSFVINATDLAAALSTDDDSTVFWGIVH